MVAGRLLITGPSVSVAVRAAKVAPTDAMDNPLLTNPRSDAVLHRLLRNPNFLLLWSACGIGALGNHLSAPAVLTSLGAANRPESAFLMARMTVCFMLPFFLLGPLAGWLADRLPRKWIMVTADSVRAALMLIFTGLTAAFENWGPWGPLLPLALVGVFAAGFSPARSSLLPLLIRPDQLMRANALISGLGILAAMLGFYFGGLLAEHYHPATCFRMDAGIFAAGAILLLMLRPPGRPFQTKPSAPRQGQWWRGFTYARQHKRVLQLIGLAVIFWSAGTAVCSTLPAVVTRAYGEDYGAVATYQAALGLGFVLGALALAALGNALRGQIAITWSMLGAGAAAALLAATVLLPLAPDQAALPAGRRAAGLAACAVLGFFGAGILASCNALLQRIVPDRYRGRVFGVNDMATAAALLGTIALLALPHRGTIGLWVGPGLVGAAGLLIAAGVVSLWVRLSRSPFGVVTGFLVNLNEFYCRWWFRLQRQGPCTVPSRGPVIVAANHITTIDPLLLLASCPHRLIGFMAASEYYHLPVVQHLLRRNDCIPVDRDGRDLRSMRTAINHLRRGKVLGIFPEGRIPGPGAKLGPKKGVALLALRSGAVVVPAHISGTRWSRRVLWPFLRRHRARVRFGRPIDLSAYRQLTYSRDVQLEVARLIMQRIRQLSPSVA